MKNFVLGATAIMLASEYVVAKEKLVIKEDAQMAEHKRPKVDAYECRLCAVDEEDASVCLTYGMNWKLGWQWDQEWYDDPSTPDLKDGFYKLGLEIYSEQGGGISTLIDVERFYFNNF